MMRRDVSAKMASYNAMEQLRDAVAIIVPVWYPKDLVRNDARALLDATLNGNGQLVNWENVWVVVDGQDSSLALARSLRTAYKKRLGSTFRVARTEVNRGKGYAMLEGIRAAFENPAVRFVAIRDCDGDHFMNDLPNMVRLARQIELEEKTDNILIIGRRSDVHGALGFVRGEYELLVSSMVVEALKFRLASRGNVFDMRFAAMHVDVPDLNSGYKLYSRKACETFLDRFDEARRLLPGFECYRYGVETIPFVEAVLGGATFGEVARLSFLDQPASGHGAFARDEVNAQIVAWAFLRLEVSSKQAQRLVDNRLARSMMFTDGALRKRLLRFRDTVVRLVGKQLREDFSLPPFNAPNYL